MELILMVALVLLNAGYIYYLHRRIRRLDETNRVQAAANRRLVVSALEVGGELRAAAADLKKQEAAASAQREKLIRFLLGIVKDNYREYAASNRNGNGKRSGKGQTPGNGRVLHEQPGIPPYDGLN